MKRKFILASLTVSVVAFTIADGCRKPDIFDDADGNEAYSGGSQTVFDNGSGAFGHSFPDMSSDKTELHATGDIAFSAPFVTAPAPLHSGLGPVYNNVSCSNCHVADGRGKPPEANEQLLSMLFRISIPGTDEHGGPNPVPGFGGQLQQRAIAGKQPEADVAISYTYTTGQYADGTTYELRTPAYTLQNAYEPLPPGVMLSPRVAPPVFGLGLLEAVPEETILSFADPQDSDGDGISGKPNYVWDVKAHQMALGRFGWKCGAPDLLQQSAGAYNQDMGVTNYLFPQESCSGQPQYDGLNDETEVPDSVLYAAAFYVRTLAVPARRNLDDPRVQRGKILFSSAKCSSCHIPAMQTGTDVSFPEISNQYIFPYTDMLLHDMGPGLADNRPDYDATGQEWRTQPLWGIGLTQIVNGHQYFLHDGRARSLEEAILWHGGEGEFSKNAFVAMSATDRDALIAFLRSL
ncbi:MAG TPA: di-heme oxidoredictase family protein [Bacteroidia bacterium]|nr:di-heme oxidoredictase family protein [Bacteroidia bacterium]